MLENATATIARAATVPVAPKLTRAAVEEIVASGRRLLVQGAMGIHASDGITGKVAAHSGARLVGVGTVSSVLKTPEHLLSEIRRAKLESGGGYVGVNFMAAVNRSDFETGVRLALAEGVSFIVQGAGVSREIVKWCREAKTPFVGIVSSGRLATMYEKWGADLLVAEGAEAGGHIGDIGHSLPTLVEEVRAATSLPVIAAGGIDASDLPAIFATGVAGAQLSTRFLASSDGDVHPNFKRMHLMKTDEDVTLIKSCVKGMNARAIRNAFTEKLARGERVPPRSKRWVYGDAGYYGRKKACVECLGAELCLARASDYKESFCISDALLAAAIEGDMENGLFYTGQSVTRIRDLDIDRLPSIAELFERFEDAVRPVFPVLAAAAAH